MFQATVEGDRPASWGRFAILFLAASALAAWALPESVFGQIPEESPPDSTELVEEAREAQREFERFRESRIPPRTRVDAYRCDERIGRICQWFGGEDEADFPSEPPETGVARSRLLGTLGTVWSQVKDPWVAGQVVFYLAEEGRLGDAERVVRDCGLTEPWWCRALLGYVLHLRGDHPAAEDAFLNALAELPEGERERWTTPRFILTGDAGEAFRSADPEQRRRLWERLWRLSEPLFLVEGNDRLTEHYARLVEARIREDAAHPFQMAWEEDLEEALIRYGRYVGWSRVRSPPRTMTPGLQDTRSVVGHHHPASRGYLFPAEFLESPADIPPEVWITGPREARTWHVAPYAPDFQGLETQVGRFRRGDSLLVVGAFQPDAESPLAGLPGGRDEPRDPFARRDPFAGDVQGEGGPVESGLFLVPEDGGEVHQVRGQERAGVLTLLAPTGRYVSSVEVLDEAGGAAWRARQGVTQTPIARGIAALSDAVILREGAPIPEDLEEALSLVRRGIRVPRGQRFVLAWEVYGLEVEERGRVTIGFSSGRPGFLRRVGEFLGVIEPDAPVEITFDETVPGEVQTVFRAIELELPDLEPGEYTLHVQLELPGREPSIASRPITVIP